MDKTPGQVAYEIFYAAYLIEDPHLWDALPDFDKNLWESAAAAVISLVTPQIRAAAFEDAKKACTIPDGEGTYTYWPCIKSIDAISNLPPSHVCVPAEPSGDTVAITHDEWYAAQNEISRLRAALEEIIKASTTEIDGHVYIPHGYGGVVRIARGALRPSNHDAKEPK